MEWNWRSIFVWNNHWRFQDNYNFLYSDKQGLKNILFVSAFCIFGVFVLISVLNVNSSDIKIQIHEQTQNNSTNKNVNSEFKINKVSSEIPQKSQWANKTSIQNSSLKDSGSKSKCGDGSDCNCNCEEYCVKIYDLKNKNGEKSNKSETEIEQKGKVTSNFWRQETGNLSFKSSLWDWFRSWSVSRSSSRSKLKPNRDAVRNVFILTTWRSGSSFFGEALSSHPAIFYHFEPLMYFEYQEISSGKELADALWTLRHLSSCNYSAVDKYMNKIRHAWNLLSLNNKISEECEARRDNCFNFSFLRNACEAFPVQLFKLTRLRGTASEELLKQFQNVKIIYLVRDPRAIYSSRMKVGWCPQSTPCGQIKSLCNSLNEDLLEIRKLQSKYPDKIQVIKYEHVALKPDMNFRKIFAKLEIPWDIKVHDYIRSHTSTKNTNDPMSTVKVSTMHIDSWKNSLAKETIENVEKNCYEFMVDLHYKFMHSPPV